MATTRVYLKATDQPTEKEIEEIKAAAKLPESYDDDSPELTDEQYAAMAKAAKEQREAKAKPVVALRISRSTLDKAKATGKGYTGFLSRLLDNAIDDPDLVARSLHG